MNPIFNIGFPFFNLTSKQFPSHMESLYLSFQFSTFISIIHNIFTFGWWRVNNEGTQIWSRVEKREKNEEYILVKDVEGLNGKSKLTRIEIFSRKGNNEKKHYFFPAFKTWSYCFEVKINLICGFQILFFWQIKIEKS